MHRPSCLPGVEIQHFITNNEKPQKAMARWAKIAIESWKYAESSPLNEPMLEQKSLLLKDPLRGSPATNFEQFLGKHLTPVRFTKIAKAAIQSMVNLNTTSNRLTRPQRMTKTNRLMAATLLAIAAHWPGGIATAASSSLLSGTGPETMDIDILPGNADNTINLARQRLIPVAILGSASFDINDFNPRTLKLRAVEQNLVGKSDKTMCVQKDINDDSYMDLICDIKTIGFRIEPGDIEVIISAGTYQRLSLHASGVLRYVAE